MSFIRPFFAVRTGTEAEGDMYADNTGIAISTLKTIRRRPVGRAAWRKTVEDLITSEKEDLKDMQKLRELLANDVKGLRLLAQMQERKTERIVELTQLLQYRSPEDRKRTVDAAPAEEELYPKDWRP
jgi:hypothetical protein